MTARLPAPDHAVVTQPITWGRRAREPPLWMLSGARAHDQNCSNGSTVSTCRSKTPSPSLSRVSVRMFMPYAMVAFSRYSSTPVPSVTRSVVAMTRSLLS